MYRKVFSACLLVVMALGLLLQQAPRTTAQEIAWAGNDSPSRGYLTTIQELEEMRELADRNVQPYKKNVHRLLRDAGHPNEWEFGTVWGEIDADKSRCYTSVNYRWDLFLSENYGAQEVYRKAVAYHLSGDVRYARSARDLIIDLTDTYSYGGNLYSGDNTCIIKLAFSIPVWIMAADLLEGTSAWTWEDKDRFQNWLAEQVYPKVAWASRSRANNWGSSGSLSAAMIADYMADRNFRLTETMPEARTLSPGQAYREHNQLQLDRMTGVFEGDAQCRNSGIQWYGGIPEELRRGSTGCNGRWLFRDDSALTYQTIHVEHLVLHAEFLLRRGDTRLYDNGLILKAIKFVVANPFNRSRDWLDFRKGTLFVAYAYYRDRALFNSAIKLDTFKAGGTIPYAPLTHPLEVAREQIVFTQPPR